MRPVPLRAGLLGLIAILASAFSAAQTQTPEQVRSLLERAQRDTENATQYLDQAWREIQQGISNSGDSDTERARWLRVQWLHHLLNDDHTSAKASLIQSIAILRQETGDSDELAETYHDLSYSEILLGEIAAAKRSLREAIVIALESGDQRQQADFFYAIGDAHLKTGELRAATRYFEAAHEKYAGMGDRFRTVMTELKLGTVSRMTGHYDTAIAYHLPALEFFSENGLYRELVTQIELARDFLAAGDLARAAHYASLADSDSRALLEQQLDAKLVKLAIANTMLEADSSHGAAQQDSAILISDIRKLLNSAVDREATNLARPIRRVRFAREIIRNAAVRQDFDEIVAAGEASLSLTRQIADRLITQGEDHLAWLSESFPLIVQYVGALYANPAYHDELVRVLEDFGRYRRGTPTSGPTGLVQDQIQAQLTEALDALLESERRIVDASSGVSSPEQNDDISQLRRQRDLARDRYLLTYAKISPDLEEHVPESVPEFHSAIPDSDVVLRFFVQESASFVALTDANETRFFELPSRSVIQRMVRDALNEIDTVGTASGAKSLEPLRGLLPTDELRQLDGKVERLIVIADDVVHLVPFSALDISVDGSVYEPLTETFEVVRTHSISAYYEDAPRHLTHDSENSGSPDIVIFADPDFSGVDANITDPSGNFSRWARSLTRLRYSASEASHIHDSYSQYDIELHLGQFATDDVLTSPAARSARILHIATHGYYDSSTPDIVGIATATRTENGLASGGFLSLTELLSNRFDSNLVVISGCDTMRGDAYFGLGVRSIADGFLAQGAQSAIGTIWKVSDRATAVFMGYFYSELAISGGNSSFALASAKRRMLQSGRFSDPRYWAAFVLDSSHNSADKRAL